jgi:enoyl-CoA hydratase
MTGKAVVERDVRGDVIVLRMNYGKVSALDTEFCNAMVDELDSIERDGPRALVLTGTGTTFSAGVNLFRLLDGGAEYVHRFLPALDRFFRTLLLFSKPLVVAVNGHAIAGGCILVSTADYRVMARGPARIGLPELRVGVPFPRLPLEIVAARVSPAELRALVYSARTMEADEAKAVGLVDEVVDPDQLLDCSIAHANALAEIPAQTFALTKRALNAGLLERVANADAAATVAAWHSAEVYDGIRRYLEKTVRKGQGGDPAR